MFCKQKRLLATPSETLQHLGGPRIAFNPGSELVHHPPKFLQLSFGVCMLRTLGIDPSFDDSFEVRDAHVLRNSSISAAPSFVTSSGRLSSTEVAARFIFVVVLELFRFAFGKRNHRGREVGQLRHIDTQTLVADAWFHLVQQCDVAVLSRASLALLDVGNYVKVAHVLLLAGKVGQLVEVCSEEALATHVGSDPFRDGPCKTEAVVGRCSTSELVDDDERV